MVKETEKFTSVTLYVVLCSHLEKSLKRAIGGNVTDLRVGRIGYKHSDVSA